jgi:hypothetical protein
MWQSMTHEAREVVQNPCIASLESYQAHATTYMFVRSHEKIDFGSVLFSGYAVGRFNSTHTTSTVAALVVCWLMSVAHSA